MKQHGSARAVAYLIMVVCVAMLMFAVMGLLSACTPRPPSGPNYEATLAYVEADLGVCAEGLAECDEAYAILVNAPTQTPYIIVVTPVPPTKVPTATPPAVVSCENMDAGTIVKVVTRTTVRSYHSTTDGTNLGQAEVGTLAVLIDTWYDTGASVRWIKADDFETNDHPEGVRGYVKELYAGCIPPEPE